MLHPKTLYTEEKKRRFKKGTPGQPEHLIIDILDEAPDLGQLKSAGLATRKLCGSG